MRKKREPSLSLLNHVVTFWHHDQNAHMLALIRLFRLQVPVKITRSKLFLPTASYNTIQFGGISTSKGLKSV
jgi:hypothetical protein